MSKRCKIVSISAVSFVIRGSGVKAVSYTHLGTTIRIIADGADEQAAVDGLVKLVSSGFAE